MAERKSFPMLPGAHWWALREKFKQSMPGVVTDSYLAAALNMQARSARGNVLPYLKDVGLIDAEGKPQDLAKAWRDDHQYPDVCKQIREGVYPDDLLSAVPDATADRAAAERWFANHTGAGTSAVRRMSQFYSIVVAADLTNRTEKKPKATGKKSPPPPKKPEVKSVAQRKPPEPSRAATPTTPSTPPPKGRPGISINLEIHISADASPDQIDKIFESMAKHIYTK